MTEVAPPLRDGRYRLVAVLGAGGMAVVYRGWDERLRVHRAIKVLASNLAALPPLRKRFEDEARTMAQLRHPNIVTVHDVDEDGDRPFIVMELLEGGSLLDRIRGAPLEPRAASGIVRGVLAGLAHAHAAGVIHRDVKPHNVLLDRDGTPKLTDFGIARVQNRALTSTGEIMGTWAYMAPEQREDGKAVDARSDVYAVGMTLYVALTGADPFAEGERDVALAAVREGAPSLADVIERATRRDPGSRHPSAEALAEALAEAHASLAGAEEPPPARRPPAPVDTGPPTAAGATFLTEEPAVPAAAPPARLSPDASSRWARLGAAAVGVGALLGVTGWWLQSAPRDPATRDLVESALQAPRPVRDAPAPAPDAPRLTPPPAGPARITVVGDRPRELWLDGPDGRVGPGVVAPGTYTVWTSFDAGPVAPSGVVRVAPGERVELRCDAGWRRCE